MRPSDVVELVEDQLYPLFEKEKDKLERIDSWYKWDHPHHRIPREATQEMRELVNFSRTPWLNLVVSTVAQAMYVDGYRSPSSPVGEVSSQLGPWRTWQANDFDNRQVQIHRAALAYGCSYVTVLPGDMGGVPTAVMRGVSPRKMLAIYAEPAEDDWPMFAIQVEGVALKNGDTDRRIKVYDEENIYYLVKGGPENKVEFIEARAHGASVCPVVRYANQLDLDGRTPGEVEPFIPLAQRINKTSFDRLVTQHFASWKVRYVAGLVKPESDEEANLQKMILTQDRVLVSESAETKFGTLDETPLDGFIRAEEADVEKLAAVSQTPATALTGKIVNVAAEALAQARAPLTQKIAERQKSMGKSHDQALRLAAALEGDEIAANDVMAHVTWQDMDIRSLSQAADALGKVATMLHVPPQALWGRIPGVTKLDVDEWVRIAESTNDIGGLQALLEGQFGDEPSIGALDTSL